MTDTAVFSVVPVHKEEQRRGSFTPKLLLGTLSAVIAVAAGVVWHMESQDISGWKGATGTVESNSLLLAGLLETKP